MKRLLAAVVLALGFVSCAEAKNIELKPFYVCKGTDPTGDQYQVYMETRKIDGVTMYQQWLENGHVIVFGTGFYDKDLFVATQWFGGEAANSATMLYRIKGKTLVGRWMPVYDGKLYPETCIEADGTKIPKPAEQADDAPTGRV